MGRWTLNTEVLLLQKYAMISTKGIIEIGILDGETTAKIAEVSTVPIYGIDPIIGDSMEPSLIGHVDRIKENMSFYPNFIFIKDYSYNVVKIFHFPFDFIFIDGSHLYKEVKRDLEEWSKLLESGGYIAFHDSSPTQPGSPEFPGWPGPTRVVEEMRYDRRFEHIDRIDTINVFKKL